MPPFDKFYLDMNGIIHHCSHGNDANVAFRPNAEIFKDIMGYLELLVSKIKPRQVLYLAVDGVAPRAKMNQQRSRRFRSAQEARQQQAKSQNNNNLPQAGPAFDSNCITPGTIFMQELCEFLQDALAEKVASDPAWRGFKTVFSGPDVPGEGEHKIMDYIRHCKAQFDYDPNVRHCLYGLDADLILLGLLSHDPHFALLREEIKFTGGKKQRSNAPTGPARFFLMHLGLLREYIGLEFNNRFCEYSLERGESFNPDESLEYEDFDPDELSIRIKDLSLAKKEAAGSSPFVSTERILDDLILLMCLVGNDFLPNLPHLHINECALAIIWAAYKRIGKHVNEFGRVNYGVLREILAELLHFERECYEREGALQFDVPVITNRERTMLRSLLAGLQGEERQFSWLSPSNISINERSLLTKLCEESGLEFAMSNDARVRLSSSDLGVIMEAQKLIYAYIEAPPEDGLDGLERWKRHYHDRKFGPAVQQEDVVRAYLDGIQWVMSYYYDGVGSWSWFFPYHYAEHLSDLYEYLTNHPDFRATEFDIGEPFSPLNQLMAVLPPDSNHHIPVPALRTLLTSPTSPLADFYPRTFRSDQNGKRASWEAVVLIPFIDAARLVEQVRKALPADYVPPNPGCDWEFAWGKGEKQPFLLPPIPKGLLRGLCDGVQDTIPGFPKLAYLAMEPRLERAHVCIFPPLQPSGNVSLCLQAPSRPLSAKIEELMYFEWPFVRETKVLYVDDGFVRSYVGGKRESSDIHLHQRALEKQQSFWQKRFGVFFEGDALVYGNLLLGMQMMPDGSLQKRWSHELACMPLSLAVPHSAVQRDERHKEKKSVITKDAFPTGATVLSMRGRRGTVKGFSFSTAKDDAPKVTVQWLPDPFCPVVLRRTPWIQASELANEIKISNHLLAKLSASLYVYYDGVSEEHTDIGLLMKFEGREKAAEGLARKNPNGLWEYSLQGAELIRKYVSRFYKIIRSLEHQVRPILPRPVLAEIEQYLKEIGVGKWKMVDSKQDRLEPSAVGSLTFRKAASAPNGEAAELVSAVGLISSAVAGSFFNSQLPQNVALGQPVYVCDRMCFGAAGYVIAKGADYVEVKLEEPGPTGISVSLPLTSIILVPFSSQAANNPKTFNTSANRTPNAAHISQWTKPLAPAVKVKPQQSYAPPSAAATAPPAQTSQVGRSVPLASLFGNAKEFVPSSQQQEQPITARVVSVFSFTPSSQQQPSTTAQNQPHRINASLLKPTIIRKPPSDK